MRRVLNPLAAGAQPDAVVLDLAMPGTDGPDLIAELRLRTPAVKVVALSAFAADEVRGAAFDHGAHAYLEKDVDPDGRFLKVNAALCALVGHSEAALLAAGFAAVVHPEDRDTDLEQLKRLLGGEVTGYQLQERCRRIDGEAISVLCNTWLVTNHRGEPLHLDGRGRPRHVVRQRVDLRESRHPEDQLAWRATHDALTGLPNRGLFLDRLEMTLARLGRDPGLAAVLVLDLDRFKEVAERFGDDAVDRLLVAVAGRLRSILRPSDTVSRFGSDEFAVLCA